MKTSFPAHRFYLTRNIAAGLLLGLSAALHFSPASAVAAETGSLTGTVGNIATGQNLEGAEVSLAPGGRTTLTRRDGRYEFTGLAAGAYTVTATYAGLERVSALVSVAAGGAATRDLGLTSAVYKLEKFVVEGEREGNALAITERRNAGNVKDVISSDAFGNVADLNLGNFLQRMPGVSKEESEGEIYLVRIRGVDSNLNAVSIEEPSFEVNVATSEARLFDLAGWAGDDRRRPEMRVTPIRLSGSGQGPAPISVDIAAKLADRRLRHCRLPAVLTSLVVDTVGKCLIGVSLCGSHDIPLIPH